MSIQHFRVALIPFFAEALEMTVTLSATMKEE